MLGLLEQILRLTQVEITGVAGGLSQATSKRLFESIPTLTEQLGLEKVESLRERLARRERYINQYPEERHWDYPEEAEGDKTILVSTKGDVVQLDEQGKLIIRVGETVQQRYYQITCLLDNGFRGEDFVVTEKEFIDHIGQQDWIDWALGKGTYRKDKGIIVIALTSRSLCKTPERQQQDARDCFFQDARYFNGQITPILGQITLGPHKGMRFSFLGWDEVEEFFQAQRIEQIIKGTLIPIQGFHFRYVNHDIAMPFHGKLTQAIFDKTSQYC